ncbi:hypothetical protein E4U55_008275 [Claviceps digitariae]|nr:hypothetical protein E4U55_008275 [Claviceps digitariae]
MALGLQVLSRELLVQNPSSSPGTQSRALIITPRPVREVLRSLHDSLTAQQQQIGAHSDAGNASGVLANCLERVMLSCVFDMDGLWEVLSDLDDDDDDKDDKDDDYDYHDDDDAQAEAQMETDDHIGVHKTREIQDSQDADEEEELLSTTPPPPPDGNNNKNRKSDSPPPSFILITHFSTLLNGLFTQRERQAALMTVSQVGARIGHLSRHLASNPLIMILNSVTEIPASEAALDPSLQSIFSPRVLDIPGYNAGTMPRRMKPSFGLVFTQLLDMHLLCSRVLRTGHHGMEARAGGVAGEQDTNHERRDNHHSGARFVTVVEVLMDEMGVWQGRRGPRPSREQRWTAIDVVRGRVSCAMQAW